MESPSPSPGRGLSPLLLVAPVVAFFAPMLFFGRAPYLRDTGTYFEPHKALIGRALHEGRLPQWNPFTFGGSPLLVDPNFNVFHPLSLLTDLWPTPWGYAAFAAANALLAALGTWVLARRLGLAREASLIAALCYAWSGTYVSLIEGGQFVAASTLPWLLAAGVTLAQAPSIRSFALAAIAGGAMLVSGTPEVGACGFALAALLTLAEAQGRRGHALGWFGGAVLFGLALAAVQVLPTLLFMRHSSRAGGWTLKEATDFSLHPLRLLNVAFPFFSGDVNAPGGAYWISTPGVQRPYIPELYAGLVPLLLAAVGAVTTRSRSLRWLMAATVALVVVSFGSYTPVYEALWKALPPLRSVRFPEKFFVPAALTIALLAGTGWSWVWTSKARRWRFAAVAAGIVALATLGAVVALDGRFDSWLDPARALCLRHTFIPSLLIELTLVAIAAGLIAWHRRLALALLIVVELGRPALHLDETVPSDEMTRPAVAAELLQRSSKGAPEYTWRFDMESHARPDDIESGGDPSWSRSHKLFSLRHAALYGTQPALDGLYQIRGYSGFTSGAMKALFGSDRPARVMSFLGVRYGVEYGSARGSPYLRLGFTQLDAPVGPLLHVWMNPSAGPKLHLIDAVLADTREGLLPVCGARDAVWLSAADQAQLPAVLPVAPDCAHVTPSALADATATLTTYEPEHVVAQVETPAPALLVLNDATDPGWSVQVDGAAFPSLAADGALRAVPVPAGRHEVRWRYGTPGLRLGALISILALTGLLLLALGSRRAR